MRRGLFGSQLEGRQCSKGGSHGSRRFRGTGHKASAIKKKKKNRTWTVRVLSCLVCLFACLLFFLLCGTGSQPWEMVSSTMARPSKLSQTCPESRLPSDPRVSQTSSVNHHGNPCSRTGEIHYKMDGWACGGHCHRPNGKEKMPSNAWRVHATCKHKVLIASGARYGS